MRKITLGLLAAAAIAVTSQANAAIIIGSVTPGTDPYSGPDPTYDFDANTPPTTGGQIATGTVVDVRAQPWGSSGNYYSVGPSSTTSGTIDLSAWEDINSISFLWGSVDSFNTLEFLDGTGGVLATFTGSDIFDPANGSQTDPNLNPLVTFLLSGSDIGDFAGLRLNSGTNAFEIDNVSINTAVPEASTWAMMLLGFGAAGFAMRRRRPQLAQLA